MQGALVVFRNGAHIGSITKYDDIYIYTNEGNTSSTEDNEKQLEVYIKEIENLIQQDNVPECLNKPKCKKCAYYEYCYV